MTRRARVLSSILTGAAVAAVILLGVGIAGLFLNSAALWLIGMRGSLTILGVLGLSWGVIVGYDRLRLWRSRLDASIDRSTNALPLPAELAAPEAELLRLGFVRVGQTETRDRSGKGPRVYEALGTPLDPRIVANLSFSRTRTIFSSYLMDGRVIETGYPPLGLAEVKVPKGWRLLPEWLTAYDCADGVEPALRLHQSALASEAARGFPALPIPGYQTLIHWENVAMLRVRAFHQHQLWLSSRNVLWIVPLALVSLWLGAFATWQ